MREIEQISHDLFGYMKWVFWAFLCLLLVVSPGCGGGDDEAAEEEKKEGLPTKGTGEPVCPVGAETCSCTTGGACDEGLTCLSAVCVRLGGEQDNVSATDVVDDNSDLSPGDTDVVEAPNTDETVDVDTDIQENTDTPTDGDDESDVKNDTSLEDDASDERSESSSDDESESDSDDDSEGEDDFEVETVGDDEEDSEEDLDSESASDDDDENDQDDEEDDTESVQEEDTASDEEDESSSLNLVNNGDFEDGKEYWELTWQDGDVAASSTEDGEYCVLNASDEAWLSFSLGYPPTPSDAFEIEAGVAYTFSFTVYGYGEFEAKIGQVSEPYDTVESFEELVYSSSGEEISYTVVSDVDEPAAGLVFNGVVEEYADYLCFDNVVFRKSE